MGYLTGEADSTVGGAIRKAAVRREPTEAFRWIRGHQDRMLEYQFGIARWIMASLLIINGGGLLALRDVVDKHPSSGVAATWFLIGIISAVLVGTFAWFNCNCITVAIDHRTDWENVDYKDSPRADHWDVAAITFAWLSVGAVAVSLAAFTAGAIQTKIALGSW